MIVGPISHIIRWILNFLYFFVFQLLIARVLQPWQRWLGDDRVVPLFYLLWAFALLLGRVCDPILEPSWDAQRRRLLLFAAVLLGALTEVGVVGGLLVRLLRL